jgi:hypothetical protein
MRRAPAAVTALLFVALSATPGRAFSDAQLIDGFNRTVFGSEYPSWGWQAYMVKKFAGPVRFAIIDRSAARRGGEVAQFVRSLPGLIRGLDARLVENGSRANFRIFVVDRAQYRDVVANEIYNRPSSAFAPGKCLVRVISGRNGISRSDAVIVNADFTRFDRHILNMLYHPALRPGMTKIETRRILPEVAAEVRARLD